ncbi:MAG: hypothetical protein SFT90_05100 [Rickettsiales bacterium]|nr:hypothetical protein [Rickettsiales bacterium]
MPVEGPKFILSIPQFLKWVSGGVVFIGSIYYFTTAYADINRQISTGPIKIDGLNSNTDTLALSQNYNIHIYNSFFSANQHLKFSVFNGNIYDYRGEPINTTPRLENFLTIFSKSLTNYSGNKELVKIKRLLGDIAAKGDPNSILARAYYGLEKGSDGKPIDLSGFVKSPNLPILDYIKTQIESGRFSKNGSYLFNYEGKEVNFTAFINNNKNGPLFKEWALAEFIKHTNSLIASQTNHEEAKLVLQSRESAISKFSRDYNKHPFIEVTEEGRHNFLSKTDFKIDLKSGNLFVDSEIFTPVIKEKNTFQRIGDFFYKKPIYEDNKFEDPTFKLKAALVSIKNQPNGFNAIALALTNENSNLYIYAKGNQEFRDFLTESIGINKMHIPHTKSIDNKIIGSSNTNDNNHLGVNTRTPNIHNPKNYKNKGIPSPLCKTHITIPANPHFARGRI